MNFEREESRIIHKIGLPLLVSSISLRKRGLGQIDISILRDGKVFVYETKLTQRPSHYQLKRLKGSCDFIGVLLGRMVLLKIKSLRKVCLF